MSTAEGVCESNAHVHGNERTCHPVPLGQQWMSMAQRNVLFQAVAIQTILISKISSVLFFVFIQIC